MNVNIINCSTFTAVGRTFTDAMSVIGQECRDAGFKGRILWGDVLDLLYTECDANRETFVEKLRDRLGIIIECHQMGV